MRHAAALIGFGIRELEDTARKQEQTIKDLRAQFKPAGVVVPLKAVTSRKKVQIPLASPTDATSR